MLSHGSATISLTFLLLAATLAAGAQRPAPDDSRGGRMIADYFRAETARVAQSCLADVKTLDDWTSRRETYRQQLFEMLGLDPLPERTDLKPVVTRRIDRQGYTVEMLEFQSRPGLYVTGNLFVPKGLAKPAPTILYVCGHSRMKKNGISYGNKVDYQHHAVWFAEHGYVCLTIDTLQLGEIEGIHHGTYSENMWWWLSRGYTPAGVEAWNCIRALDYLQSRKEVDPDRIGVTGRSGGGAYSWWIGALDDRIKVAVPVAGITDLTNHVVDGTVDGHCDCMFMVNTYRWDYAQVAALMAPRPLLLTNTDKDPIFPLDGVMRIHEQVRRIYRLYGAGDKFAVQISEGPHKDTPEQQVAAFRWFNRFLKGEEDSIIDKPALKVFEMEDLKVFDQIPADQLNTKIQETFTATAATPQPPKSEGEWHAERDAWLTALGEKCFRGWPRQAEPLDMKPAFSVARQGIHFEAHDFTSQDNIRLRLYVAHRDGLKEPKLVVLNALDAAGWSQWLASMRPGFDAELKDELQNVVPGESPPAADEKSFAEAQQTFANFAWVMAYVAPRGVGPTAWNPKWDTPNRRRFMILGQTRDGMQTWDVRRGVQAVRTLAAFKNAPLWLQGERQMAGMVLYASLFEPNIARLDLWALPTSHRDGPMYLGVQRFLDMPQAVAMAAERSRVRLYTDDPQPWQFPLAVRRQLGWNEKQLEIMAPPGEKKAAGG